MKTIIFTLLTSLCIAQDVTYLLPNGVSAIIQSEGKEIKIKRGKSFILDKSKQYTLILIEGKRREEYHKYKGEVQIIKTK